LASSCSSATEAPGVAGALAPATVVLGCHGSAGAARAVAAVLELARPGRTTVVHCLVVPDLWAGMQGDDWLNNASTRDAFGRYVEDLLGRDAAREFAAVEKRCAERGLAYRALLRYGEPTACLAAAAAEVGADLVAIGPPRPKGEPGLKSRIDLERLVRALRCPLLVACGA